MAEISKEFRNFATTKLKAKTMNPESFLNEGRRITKRARHQTKKFSNTHILLKIVFLSRTISEFSAIFVLLISTSLREIQTKWNRWRQRKMLKKMGTSKHFEKRRKVSMATVKTAVTTPISMSRYR